MSTGLNVTYGENNALPFRFIDNAKFALKKDLGEREGNLAPNLMEKIGNFGLSVAEELPKRTWQLLKEPRFVSLALTILALGANSYLFYPDISVHVVKAGLEMLPHVPLWTVKFSLYLLISATISSFGLRAQGRFWNEDLKSKFWGNK